MDKIHLHIISTAERKLNEAEIIQLHHILKIAYEVTEVGIWGEDYDRLFIDDFRDLIDEGCIYVAYLDGKIVGSLQVYSENKTIFKFSLLSVDFNCGGKGIGSALINKAEELAVKSGAKQMNIEILRAKDFDVPHKIRLAKYYKRLGYNYTHSDDASCLIPDWKYKLLITPSNFDFYTKRLL